MSEEKKGKKFPAKRVILSGAALLFVALVCLLQAFLPFGALFSAASVPAREEGETRLHFLDVGQGDCTIVEFSDGELLVVDGGAGDYWEKIKLVRYVKGLHAEKISLLLTHADRDHYGGLTALLGAFEIERCYLPQVSSENGSYLAFLDAVEKNGCATAALSRYDSIRRDGAYLVCLSLLPTEETDENDASTVLYFNSYGVRALLCGDITSSCERQLLREYGTDGSHFQSGDLTVDLQGIDVLKAAHHGSAGSSSAEWLQLLRPDVLLVSCGAGNSYGLPAGEALARFRTCSPEGKIYRTDEAGDVIVSIKDGGYTVGTREVNA